MLRSFLFPPFASFLSLFIVRQLSRKDYVILYYVFIFSFPIYFTTFTLFPCLLLYPFTPFLTFFIVRQLSRKQNPHFITFVLSLVPICCFLLISYFFFSFKFPLFRHEGFWARDVPSTDILKKTSESWGFEKRLIIASHSWQVVFGGLNVLAHQKIILDFSPFLGTKMVAALSMRAAYIGVELICNQFNK